MAEAPPLILTLKLDDKSFAYFNALRQQYFPPERNFLPAHITLFHHLPPEQEPDIQQDLRSHCLQTPPLPLHFPTVRFFGRGVAIAVDCPALETLRQQLATTWHERLSRQDQQGYRPHITIQNKTTGEAARQVYQHLSHAWEPFSGGGEGLLLWRYLGGPWELIREFPFSGPEAV